jgi:hypothetical protein
MLERLVACGHGFVLVLQINGTRELFVPGLTGEQAGMMERVARGTSLTTTKITGVN